MDGFEKSYRRSMSVFLEKWDEANKRVRMQTLDLIRTTSEFRAVIELSEVINEEKLPEKILAIFSREHGEE